MPVWSADRREARPTPARMAWGWPAPGSSDGGAGVWQAHPHARARPEPAAHLDRAAHACHQAPNDGQPDAGAFDASTFGAQAVEGLERCSAAPGSCRGRVSVNVMTPALCLALTEHLAAGTAVLDRVAQQVHAAPASCGSRSAEPCRRGRHSQSPPWRCARGETSGRAWRASAASSTGYASRGSSPDSRLDRSSTPSISGGGVRPRGCVRVWRL